MAENGVGRAASGPRPVVVVVVEAAAAAAGRRSKAGGGKGGKGGKGSKGGGGPTAAQLPGSAAGRARRQARRCGAGCVWSASRRAVDGGSALRVRRARAGGGGGCDRGSGGSRGGLLQDAGASGVRARGGGRGGGAPQSGRRTAGSP